MERESYFYDTCDERKACEDGNLRGAQSEDCFYVIVFLAAVRAGFPGPMARWGRMEDNVPLPNESVRKASHSPRWSPPGCYFSRNQSDGAAAGKMSLFTVGLGAIFTLT